MDNIYLFFVIALFILAISDLVVGVGNDAVNFLNSAIGSRVASQKIIFAVASAGVLFGATFSSGMMEIARSGVFFPDQFYFNEIMVIFLAVMITDIILLDTFNTFGLPTSTTVSIVFKLLGAAVAVSLFKIYVSQETLQDLGNYINSGRALVIISGILLSVVIAFTVGSLIQFLSRLLFTFNYEKNLPYFGAVWGSIAVTSIIYFILVKGASGASFMTPATVAFIKTNTVFILGGCFIFFAVLSQILISFFKINIFKIIVLIGTFSIAMAFAGNDLVNFIGVPLAGYESFKLFITDPSLDPASFTMESLLLPVQTPTFILLLAGIIMILALIFSRKARSVTQTEVDLARQGEGYERFASSPVARTLVRNSNEFGQFLNKLIPQSLQRRIDSRFEQNNFPSKTKDLKNAPSFDMLRASVNMFVASILIALATSLKLPLSTTYVTFMVAMGTSLSDRAWGRESAVYRVTGVITVIGGWFFTALTAFTGAFVFAMFISWGGYLATAAALLLAFIFVIRTNFIHKSREKAKQVAEEKALRQWSEETVIKESRSTIYGVLERTAKLHAEATLHFMQENRKKLKKTIKKVKELNDQTMAMKEDSYMALKKLDASKVDTAHYFIQTIDYLREVTYCLNFITDPLYEHIDNVHTAIVKEQESNIKKLMVSISQFYNAIAQMEQSGKFETLIRIKSSLDVILFDIEEIRKYQIKLIREEKAGTKNSLVMFNYLTETKNMLLQTFNVVDNHISFMRNKVR